MDNAAQRLAVVGLIGILTQVWTACAASSSAPPTPLPGATDGVPGVLRAPTDGLPAPLVVAEPPSDSLAADLARQTLTGGEHGLPALLAALKTAGIAVRDAGDGFIVEPSQPSQGLAFESWEVRAIAALIDPATALVVPLDNLGEVLAGLSPELESASIVDLLLDDLRIHASGEHATLRFWAQYIIELGKQAQVSEPYDLADQVDPSEVELNSVQLSLILLRLAGDITALAGTASGEMAKRGGLLWFPVERVYALQPPCILDPNQRKVADMNAVAAKGGWVALLHYLSEHAGLEGADNIHRAQGIANVISAFMKLILAAVVFRIDMGMVSPPGEPLVRTHDAGPRASGERRTIYATVRFDIGRLEWFNCFRLFLNEMGTDFSLPNDGPIPGAGITWAAREGFSEAEAALHGGPAQIVRIARGQPLEDIADQDGTATVDVEGVGQESQISSNARPVARTARIVAQVRVKRGDVFKDMVAATGTVFGIPASLVALPFDLLQRTRWIFNGSYAFKVRDWEESAPAVFVGEAFVSHRGNPDVGGTDVDAQITGVRFERVDVEIPNAVAYEAVSGSVVYHETWKNEYNCTYTVDALGKIPEDVENKEDPRWTLLIDLGDPTAPRYYGYSTVSMTGTLVITCPDTITTDDAYWTGLTWFQSEPTIEGNPRVTLAEDTWMVEGLIVDYGLSFAFTSSD